MCCTSDCVVGGEGNSCYWEEAELKEFLDYLMEQVQTLPCDVAGDQKQKKRPVDFRDSFGQMIETGSSSSMSALASSRSRSKIYTFVLKYNKLDNVDIIYKTYKKWPSTGVSNGGVVAKSSSTNALVLKLTIFSNTSLNVTSVKLDHK